MSVDAVKVNQYGIKYDREWSVFDKKTLAPINQKAEVKFTVLRQKFHVDKKTRHKYLVFYVIPGHEDVVKTLPSKELRVLISRKLEGEVI